MIVTIERLARVKSWSEYLPRLLEPFSEGVRLPIMEKLLLTRIVARLVFGVLQIAGATAATIYLISTGMSAYTWTAVGVTAVLTLLSRILFRRERALERSRRANDQPAG